MVAVIFSQQKKSVLEKRHHHHKNIFSKKIPMLPSFWVSPLEGKLHGITVLVMGSIRTDGKDLSHSRFSTSICCLNAEINIFFVKRKYLCGPGGILGLPRWLSGKNLPVSAGDARDMGWIPGSGRSPGVGNGNPLQCSCLENPTEGSGRLLSMGSQRVRYDLATKWQQQEEY